MRSAVTSGHSRIRQRPRFLGRRARRIIAAVLAVILACLAWSVGHALTVPGGGTFSERLAEWARNHYLGPLVTFGEWISYQAPKKGGKPSFSLVGPGAAAAAGAHGKLTGRAAARAHRLAFRVPARLASPAGTPLRGEGQWRVLYRVHHLPAVYSTYLRPDSVHTSYVAGIVEMNPRLLRFQLRPGAVDPGPGSYGAAQAVITPGTRRGLAATFNGGFKMASAQGGFYLNGTYHGGLQPGAASMVYYRNGNLRIGVWASHGLRLAPNVVGVRQNLKLIVQDGQIPSTVDQNVKSNWGATLGGGYYVWRSGIGMTRNGRIVFVYGPALDVRTLADLLRRAGSVQAMQLDINPDWTNFMYYKPGLHPRYPVPVALLPNQLQSAARYYSLASRDFTVVYAK